MGQARLYWLPDCPEFRDRAKMLRGAANAWPDAAALAMHNLDFVQTNFLDQIMQPLYESAGPSVTTIRLAILSSCTVTHLHAAIRIAGLRRGLRIVIYEADYGQYLQELQNPGSGLHEFRPDSVLFAFDARHIAQGLRADMGMAEMQAQLQSVTDLLANCWKLAKDAFSCTILQQTILPALPDLLGNNEHRLPGGAAHFIARTNAWLRDGADQAGVHLIALDRRAGQDGIDAWHDTTNWHRGKQDISLHAAPVYGDLVARVIAAIAGRAAKCAVLDLDNTLWGGVIGDDGLDGIVLGQGSTEGEAFAEFQSYISALSKRGIILAVCSKNDEAVAAAAFAEHPEMVIKRSQIASFVANWRDKASNIRRIAADLNIGLDALVFIDDNPAERSLVRQELPMVAVPELPPDPAQAARCLADAGYFESVAITDEDRIRNELYQVNLQRAAMSGAATDMDSYLRGLEMRLEWQNFSMVALQRTVQLINKTNQFNLTTRRYTEEEIRAIMADDNAFGIQLRLRDKFGDNGIIAILIGRRHGKDMLLDTWLMSCRVLGRQVEEATLEIAVAEARRLGAANLIGCYKPTPKNTMVREHYPRLGFAPVATAYGGETYRLQLDSYSPQPGFIKVERT